MATKLGRYGKVLPAMTAQEVFDSAATHMLWHVEQSITDGYDPEEEWKSWADMIWDFSQSENHEDLIFELDFIHNCYEQSEWQKKLMVLASEFNLSDEVVK